MIGAGTASTVAGTKHRAEAEVFVEGKKVEGNVAAGRMRHRHFEHKAGAPYSGQKRCSSSQHRPLEHSSVQLHQQRETDTCQIGVEGLHSEIDCMCWTDVLPACDRSILQQ